MNGDDDPLLAALEPSVAVVAGAYERALSEAPIKALVSTVVVGLHPSHELPARSAQAFVYCDPPESVELITVDVSVVNETQDPAELARLAADILDASLIRLGVARSWDHSVLSAALVSARKATMDRTGATATTWLVRVEGRGATAPEQPHEISLVGGGPTNGVPRSYLDELHRLLAVLGTEAGQRWWSHSPVKLAEVGYWFDGAKPGIRVRVGRKVTANIERPLGTFDDSPVAMARADVDALLDRLTRRLGLPQPPPLGE